MTGPRPIEPLGRPATGVIRPPGSKSLTNRALVAASLAGGGPSTIHQPLDAGDTRAMREGLRGLGAIIDDVTDPWVVSVGEQLRGAAIDAADSGTTARFLTAVATVVPGESTVDGSARMRERPMGGLVAALRRLGAEIAGEALPMRIDGPTLAGGSAEVDISASTQFLSAILLAAPRAGSPTTLLVVGAGEKQSGYVSGTVEVMRAFGATATSEDGGLVVANDGYRPTAYQVEPDASAAVYPLAAAAVTGGEVTVTGLRSDTSQPDLGLLGVLAAMGCEVEWNDSGVTVKGGELRGIEVDMSSMPDAAVVLAAIALAATGPTVMTGLGTLPLKESNRLTAMAAAVDRLGGRAEISGDTIRITPGPPRQGTVETWGDHRIAMSFAVVGLARPGVTIDDPDSVVKTWPDFWDTLATL